MGSMDSGRHFRHRRLTTIELPSIDIRSIDYLQLSSESWTRMPQGINGVPIYIKKKGHDLTIGIREGNFVRTLGNIAMTWSARNYGGAQPYFACPEQNCGRRVAILYLIGYQVACRTCLNLSYESQHENKYIRSFRRAKILRIRIGANPQPLTPLPKKPKYMHQTTYDQITYMVLATEIKAFNEMKAYLHGYWSNKLHHLDHTHDSLL